MYVIRDSVGPSIRQHFSDSAFKNVMLKYFPKHTTSNGTVVFDRLIIWRGSFLLDNNHRRIYKAMDIPVKNLTSNVPSGVEYTYFYLAPYSTSNSVVTSLEVRNYIERFSPMVYPSHKNVFNPDLLDTTDMNPDPYKGTDNELWDNNGWITVYLQFNPKFVTNDLRTEGFEITTKTTDQDILSACQNASPAYIMYDVDDSNRLAFAALLDKGSSVFEKSFRIVSKQVTTVVRESTTFRGSSFSTSTKYLKSANIEMKFRRTTDANDQIADTLVNLLISCSVVLKDYANNIASRSTIYIDNSLDELYTFKDPAKELNYPINQQIAEMANYTFPAVDNEMHYTVDGEDGDYYASNQQVYIKVDGLADLPPKKFKKEFMRLLKTGYEVKKKKGHWYDKVVSIVIAIVAIVVAFYSGNWQIAALALSVGALAETAWAFYLTKNGGGTGAIGMTGKIANILGLLATLANIVNLIGSLQKAMQQEALKEGINRAAQEGALEGMDDAAMASINSAFEQTFADAAISSVQSIAADAVAATAGLLGQLGVIDGNVATIISAGANGFNFLSEGGSGSLSLANLSIESVEEGVRNGVLKFFSKPLSEILNQTVGWLNSGFNFYASTINPPNEGLADKVAQLEKMEQELEETNVDQLPYIFSCYEGPYDNIFDMNEKMDSAYAMMTVGRIMNMMNRYYNSGWKI